MILQSYSWVYIQRKPHSSTIHNSQDMETASLPISRGMGKDVVHMYNGILLSHHKEWSNVICSNMDGLRWSHQVKECQTEKDKYHITDM